MDGGAWEKSSATTVAKRHWKESWKALPIAEVGEAQRRGMLSICRKSRECSAVVGEADGEAGRADGGGERAERVPSLKLQPHTTHHRMFWLLSLFPSCSINEKFDSSAPPGRKHPLHCKDAAYKVLGLCSAGWESRVAFPRTAWE